jgi:hypothetical protein
MSAPLLPTPFLFRYSFPVQFDPALPRSGKKLLNLPAACALPEIGIIAGAATFGQLRLAWNNTGLGISVEVRGKKKPPEASLRSPTTSDGLQVWIDTRNTQNIHRASRFCHHLCLLPSGGGRTGREAAVVPLAIARAREEVTLPNPTDFRIQAEVTRTGYLLEAWLPSTALQGFDSDASPRLGFYYLLTDAELGDQPLSVGADFPVSNDPSLWSTLELTGK